MRSPEFDLADLEGILPSFLRHSGAAVALKDIDGRYLYANEGFSALADRPAVDLVGRNDEDVLPAELAAVLRAAHDEALQQRHSISIEVEILIGDRPLLFTSTHFPVFDDADRLIAIGVFAVQAAAKAQEAHDAKCALARAESENAQLVSTVRSLEELALTDGLTGAWNRRRFEESVECEIHRAARECRPLTLMLIDIDHFKCINDTLGHDAGDKVLVELAGLLRDSVRKSDSVTRWGGEEFVLLLPNTGLVAAQALAERIRERIEQHAFELVDRVTASFGVAEFVAMESWSDWLRRSDQALYEAKENGRNQVAVSRPEPLTTALEGDVRPTGNFVKLVWKHRFNSGHALIDSQHEGLVRTANELLVAVLSSSANGHATDLSQQLIRDIHQHFSDEESLLGGIEYSCLAQHRQEHAALVTKANELAAAVARGEQPVAELFQFLAYEVIMRHMLGSDRHYFPFLPATS